MATTNDPAYTETTHVQDEDVILEIQDATVTFGMERGESRVLDNVSLDVRRQEVIGVVGESGSGKSMFASSLLDAIVPPGQLSGDITYHPPNGDPIDVLGLSKQALNRYRWEHVSFVFQGAMSSFNPTMTIQEHFRETLEAHNADLKEGMRHSHELLRDLYLEPRRVMESYPHELSGGMKQRALIALSLVLEPEILVMDEPTAALDLLMQRSILSLLQQVKEKYDLTVIFITHDIPLVAGLADRIAVMYAFEIVELGPTTGLIRDATHPYTRALLRSVPNLNTDIEQMNPIEGSSPDPVNVPAGCSYHPRCSLADDQCRTQDPKLQPARDDHQVGCFHWEQSKDEIDYEVTEEL